MTSAAISLPPQWNALVAAELVGVGEAELDTVVDVEVVEVVMVDCEPEAVDEAELDTVVAAEVVEAVVEAVGVEGESEAVDEAELDPVVAAEVVDAVEVDAESEAVDEADVEAVVVATTLVGSVEDESSARIETMHVASKKQSRNSDRILGAFQVLPNAWLVKGLFCVRVGNNFMERCYHEGFKVNFGKLVFRKGKDAVCSCRRRRRSSRRNKILGFKAFKALMSRE